MSIKLIALGNVLMGDDGIAMHIAGMLEEELLKMGIKVILGETDIGYCITEVEEGDYLIVLDAAFLGKQPGEITQLAFHYNTAEGFSLSQHGMCFPDILRLHYPQMEGMILAIEVEEVGFRYSISSQLLNKEADISKEILDIIRKIVILRSGEIILR